jgi:hypothetical protein
MFKKILLASIILSIFSWVAPIQAAETCYWQKANKETGTLNYTAVCKTDYYMISDGLPYNTGYLGKEDKCLAQNIVKPNDGAIYACCCGTEAVVSSTSGQAPKFTIPEFQIPIPTIELSDPKCTVNDDGSYYCEVPWIGEYIIGLYNYGLSIAGILAAIMLMAGGIIWLISGGDASKVTQAKELIIGSVTGLIILASSYILLTQINPDLTTLKPISLGTIKAKDYEPVSTEGNPDNNQDCYQCSTLPAQIPAKNSRELNRDLVAKIIEAWGNSCQGGCLAWRVTEAYPATSKHNSTCHYNGMCFDVALTGNQNCADVTRLITILQNAGLSVLNEYTGCNGVKTANTTGGHLHVK